MFSLYLLEKLYTDTKLLTIVYIIGSVLLFIFIILLIISVKSEDKIEVIIEEPKDDTNKENKTENPLDNSNNILVEPVYNPDKEVTENSYEELNSESTDPIDTDDNVKEALDIVDTYKEKDYFYNNNSLNEDGEPTNEVEKESVNGEIIKKQDDLKAKLDMLRKNN